MSDIKIGTIVKLKDYKASSFYNGQYGLVIGEPVLDCKRRHRHPVRLFTQQFAKKELNVLPENLKVSRDDPEWIIPHLGLSILELSGTDHFRSIHGSFTYSKAICDELEITPTYDLLFRQTMDSIKAAKGKKIYRFCINAIHFYFLLEKNHGKYRLFQSHILFQLEEFLCGYPASEWCLLLRARNELERKVPLVETPAWKRWGGGRFLTDKDIEDLFKCIREWQMLTRDCLKHELLPRFLKEIDKEVLDCLIDKSPDLVPKHIQPFVDAARKKIFEWSFARIQDIKIGLVLQLDRPLRQLANRSDVSYPIKNEKGETLFEIRSSTLLAANILSNKLTGEDVSPVVFIYMLNRGIWWQFVTHQDAHYTGFFVQSYDIDLKEKDLDVKNKENWQKGDSEKILNSPVVNVMNSIEKQLFV